MKNHLIVKPYIMVRRTIRKPDIMYKVAMKTTAYSILPSTINDFAVHHSPISLSEVEHILQDTAILSAMSSVMQILVKL
jgi:hypothetical protein